MGSGGEAHRSNVAAVGAVRLHDAPPFNVVQHAGAVLLTRGQQAAAGVHRHRGHRTSCVRGATKRGVIPHFLRGSGGQPATHPSRAGTCPPLGHSWALAGPRSGPSCPGSRTRSSTPPRRTRSGCGLLKQSVNGEQPVGSERPGSGRTSVAAQRVEPLPPLAVCGVDVAVSGAGADQDGPPALGALHEGQVPDGAVVHAELQVGPFGQKTQIRAARPGQETLWSRSREAERRPAYRWRCRCRR